MTELSWQPISTAPKDAPALFFLDGIGDPRVGKWNQAFNYWMDLHTGKPMPHPDFWMPLPEPPSKAETVKPLNLGHSISTGTRS